MTITTAEGRTIRGTRKNEDMFSVQIMDTSERIQGYEKDKMKAVENGSRSVMPAFGPDRISDADLDRVMQKLPSPLSS